jgi:hypothetical protein
MYIRMLRELMKYRGHHLGSSMFEKGKLSNRSDIDVLH